MNKLESAKKQNDLDGYIVWAEGYFESLHTKPVGEKVSGEDGLWD
jgi:hypothetical protein